VSRVWGTAAGIGLFLALTLVVGWPALATVLEATRAVALLEQVLHRAGWIEGAEALARWQGLEPPGDSGSVIDPAASAAVLTETRGLARPIRLAFESIGLVLGTEALALPAGILLAVLLFRTDVWGRRPLLGLVALAAFVPIPLHATAWLGALGNAGRMQAMGIPPVLVGRFGAMVVHAMAALPWIVLVAGVGLCAVEPELEEAALLETGPGRVLARVTLRRAIGAIAAAALAVAVLTAGDMTVSDLLQIRTYAEEAYLQYVLWRNPADASIVALPPLIGLGLLILFVGRALAQLDPARLVTSFAGARLWRLGAWRLPCGLLLVLLVGSVIGFPVCSLIWRAGRVGGRAALGQPPAWSFRGLFGTLHFAAAEIEDPLRASLIWTAVAATATAVLAFGLSWAGRRSRTWRTALLTTMVITLATPGSVAGMALILAYRSVPEIADSAAMIVMAEMVRALPYALLVLWPFLRSFPQDYLDAAALDGYGPAGQMIHVALPLSLRALLAAWSVAFALGLGELPATNLVSPPGVQPMSYFIWHLLHTGVESHLAGVALIMLLVLAAAGLLAAASLRWVRPPAP
jgi:iron(III) transport system permease protein